ncbi:MAG: RDD family protein [Myxococcales bacterium]|nr:RDD family protein [Myxococcales bacterium]
MGILRRDNKRAAPCPGCDTPIDPAIATSALAACPTCGQALVPVRVAGFWRRSVALVLDGAILLVTAVPLHYAVLRVTGGWLPRRESWGLNGLLELLAADLGNVLVWLAPLLVMASLYTVLFTALMGRTPGQRAVGLVVISRRGERPRWHVAVLRLLGLLLGAIPAGLGAIWIAIDREKRGLHDHIAGTYVVRVS